MKQNTYEIEKNIEKIIKGSTTGFLLPNISQEIKKRLKKRTYQELIPYHDAEKTILYKDTPPKIKLFKIDCYNDLKHSSILGSLFALNITSETFGDIILYQDNYYIYLLESISELVKNELTIIDKYKVKLIEVDIQTLKDYKRNYEEIKIIASSLRMDTIISNIINCNREKIKIYLKEKQILINNKFAKKAEQLLKENDIFSIRKHGKYRLKEIIGKTKKENYIVLIQKYI